MELLLNFLKYTLKMRVHIYQTAWGHLHRHYVVNQGLKQLYWLIDLDCPAIFWEVVDHSAKCISLYSWVVFFIILITSNGNVFCQVFNHYRIYTFLEVIKNSTTRCQMNTYLLLNFPKYILGNITNITFRNITNARKHLPNSMRPPV